MTVLVTGGAGYIGSHTCVELLNAGYKVVVFDNLSNSHYESIQRIEHITGKSVAFCEGDIRDQKKILEVIKEYQCTAVIHLAGLKSVGESTIKPLSYYDNNFIGTYNLLCAMSAASINTLVFSSSATVYGDPTYLPLTENHPLSATNPYGRTKLIIEEMLRDYHRANPNWKITILRYFNPVGAHASGLIGEDPLGTPNNLMPFVSQVAIGKHKELNVWGNDYNTHDGTGVRDYIHITDLALGHLSALKNLASPALNTINLGTGIGYSVLDVINMFEKVSEVTIPYKIAPRRSGDVAACYACPKLAKSMLNWQAELDLEAMCRDTWLWQKNNPNGYNKVD